MAKVKLPQHYWFYDELYLFNFRLVWPVNKATLEQYVKDEFEIDYDCGPDTFDGKALVAVQESSGRRHYVVALRKWSGNADNIACLAHECNHSANDILKDRGVVTTQVNDEAHAYLAGYLLRRCLNVLLPRHLRAKVVTVNSRVKRRG